MAKLTATHDEILRILDYKGASMHIHSVAKCLGYKCDSYTQLLNVDDLIEVSNYLDDLKNRHLVAKAPQFYPEDPTEAYWYIKPKGVEMIKKLGRREKSQN